MRKRSFPRKAEIERLVLRCYASKDAAGILQLAGENREHLIREFAKNAGLQSVKEANSVVKEKKEQWNAGKAYCLRHLAKESKKNLSAKFR